MEIINVTDEIIEINVTEAVVNVVTQNGAYPLPSNVFSVFGRVGNVVGQAGDYTTSLVTEGTNLYYTQARFNTAFGNKTTTDLAEGTNLYYTDARSRAAISENITGLEYSSASGIFSLANGYLIPTQAMLDAKQDDLNGTGIVKSTAGTISYLTDNTANWDAAYNDKINSASVSGTTTKTLTLNQQDGGTITASWTDDNTDAVTSVFGRTGAVIATNGDYTTSQVTEGTNLYFTNARVHDAISANAPLSEVSGVVSISQAGASTNGFLSSTDWNTFNNKEGAVTAGTTAQYYRGDKTFQTLDTLAVPENTNLYYTQARFDTAFGNKSTTNLAEGTNLYYTDARARAAITGTAPIDVSGGVVSISQASGSSNGYLSSTDWTTFNNKQAALNGTGFVKISGTTISYDNNTYLTTISGIAAGGELSGTYANPSLVNSAVIGKVLTGLNLSGGGTIADTDSILGAFGKVQNQISALVGGVMYEGTWNASTNTPTIVSSVGSKGDYYIVATAGSTNINGITSWNIGDWIIFNGTTWDKVDNTDAVSSVNGYTGAVSLVTSDVPESGSLYFTNDRAIGSTLTGYTSGSGVVAATDTILQAIQKLNGNIGGLVTGVSSVFGRTGAVSATNGDYNTSQVTENTNLYYTEARVSANTDVAANTAARHAAVTIGTANGLSLSTQALSLALASGSATGALSSTDWNTFNNKLSTATAASTYVPYTGATTNVNLGTNSLTAGVGSFASSGSGNTFSIDHGSGSGIALNITKAGNGEGLYINKTSGTGNAVTIIGTLNATTLVKDGGTSSQFLKADGSVDSSTYLTTSSAASTYLPLAGGTLTGALSGTSATFTANANGVVLNAATGTTNTQYKVGNTSGDNYFGVAASDGSSVFGGTTAYSAYLGTNVGRSLHFATNGVVRQTIDLNGATTFTSSIAATSADFSGAVGTGVLTSTISSAVNAIFNSTNASGGYITFRRSGTPIGYLGNSAQLGIGTLNALELRADNDLFLTTTSASLRMTSGGLVGINLGTTTPLGLLSLRAQTTDTPTIVFQNTSGGPSSAIANFTSAVQTFTTIGTNAFVNSVGSIARLNTSYASCFIAFDEGDIGFSTNTSAGNPTQRMRILANGNVGIGTGGPSFKLDVRSSSGNNFVHSFTEISSNGQQCGFVANSLFSGSERGITLAMFKHVDITNPATYLSFWSGGSAFQHMYIDDSSVLRLSGSSGNIGTANGTIVGTQTSDIRLKNVKEGFNYGLDDILKINPIAFTFKNDKNNTDKLGFSAQEMLNIIPESVYDTKNCIDGYDDTDDQMVKIPKSNDTIYGMDYTILIPVLVKAIQELKAEIEILKNK